MMFCTKCGSNTAPGTRFCPSCGNRLNLPKNQNKPANKYLLGGGISILAMVLAIALININSRGNNLPVSSGVPASAGSGTRSRNTAASPETEIRQAINNFNRDLGNSLDLSVYIDGKDLDFSPLRQYFDSNQAYRFMQQLETSFNNEFSMFKYLHFGADLAGDILSGAVSAIPVFGDALSGLTRREIENDPLLNKKNWENMASLAFTPEQIETDGETATVTLTLTMKTDTRGFSRSNILRLLSIDFGNETTEERMSLTAAMKKQPNGEWVFTEFE
jgi:hypothetical protein